MLEFGVVVGPARISYYLQAVASSLLDAGTPVSPFIYLLDRIWFVRLFVVKVVDQFLCSIGHIHMKFP